MTFDPFDPRGTFVPPEALQFDERGDPPATGWAFVGIVLGSAVWAALTLIGLATVLGWVWEGVS